MPINLTQPVPGKTVEETLSNVISALRQQQIELEHYLSHLDTTSLVSYEQKPLTQGPSKWEDVATNFNIRNDRNQTIPSNPVIASDATAVDHVVNTDGSVDISLEWTYIGTGPGYDIDGFNIYVYSSSTSAVYTFGASVNEEQVYTIPANKRAFIFQGLAADSHYTFGVQAYRNVDQDVNTDGVLKSTIIKPTGAGENPYQPSSTVAFSGNVTGTVGGIAVDAISKSPATFIIGVEGSSNNIKRADYVVPAGSNTAEITINNAIGDLPDSGGKIVLLDGIYVVDNSIVLPSNVHFEISTGATIQASIVTTKARTIFTNSDKVLGNKDINITGGGIIDGSRLNEDPSSSCIGIYFKTVSFSSVSGMHIKEHSNKAIYFYECNNISISNNIIANNDNGVYLFNVGNSAMVGNVANENGWAINITGGINNTISGNTCDNNKSKGLEFKDCENSAVTGNTFQNSLGLGIMIGISNNNTFIGNICKKNKGIGIRLDSSNNNIVSGNSCIENGESGASGDSNIQIGSKSKYNSIQNNTCRKGISNPIYGIYIKTSDCIGNIVTNNDLYNSGITASFSDVGTGTITTAGNRLS